ncbi:hypothetical protein [Cycloclasticus sp.]|jgi:hypothetical protein|uniref:hypothetical protein n=1 Tax=Cycloclasticus sp. TaxID=2024830 RepID=UPI00257BE5C0|nr:hypothetical protein [Cycloclasticus sp.]|tara:strand:- start:592 stop:753 length:162 start_codon:yes stop_codon:yes gene_type:complete
MINLNAIASTEFITGIFKAIISAFQQIGVKPRRDLAETMQTAASGYVSLLRAV